jgi:hypothetical protein
LVGAPDQGAGSSGPETESLAVGRPLGSIQQGDPLKCDIVKEMIRVNRLDLVLLQETKHHSINSFMSSTFLPANLKSCSVPGRNRCLPGAAFSLEPY